MTTYTALKNAESALTTNLNRAALALDAIASGEGKLAEALARLEYAALAARDRLESVRMMASAIVGNLARFTGQLTADLAVDLTGDLPALPLPTEELETVDLAQPVEEIPAPAPGPIKGESADGPQARKAPRNGKPTRGKVKPMVRRNAKIAGPVAARAGEGHSAGSAPEDATDGTAGINVVSRVS